MFSIALAICEWFPPRLSTVLHSDHSICCLIAPRIYTADDPLGGDDADDIDVDVRLKSSEQTMYSLLRARIKGTAENLSERALPNCALFFLWMLCGCANGPVG